MQFLSKIHTKLTTFFISFYKEMIVCLILICLPILYPKTANAGLLSFLSSLTSDKVSAETIEIPNTSNSQNMLVLQSVVNYDQNPYKTESDAIFVSGNALVAEIGPSGTASEVDDQEENSTQISLYTVHEGDSLSRIAQMFGVTANTIIWANDLGRNPILQKNQKLIILPISGIKYTVKKGDTIKGIVSRYKSDLSEVLQFNDLALSSVLSVGDIIVIPDAEPTGIDTPVKKIGTSSKGSYYPGYYARPIDGGHKSQGIHGHNGVDLAAPVGTPIHASAAGTVIASITNGGWNGGYGNYVIISHSNGTQTLYSHNLKNFVSIGDRVEQGQLIAKIGMTGKTTGPHIHFEIRGAKNPF